MPSPEARRAALHLRLHVDGVTGAAELARALGVDGSTMRRLVAGDPRVLAIGQARARRYALRRVVRGVDAPIPVHALDADGRAHAVAALEPIEPRGFAVVFIDGRVETTDDLPYFLRDLCPAGFLGRAYARGVASRLGLPDDLARWTLDDHVRALVDDGADVPGGFVLGARALELALATPAPSPLARADRVEAYPRLAYRALMHGSPGASVGGEQPKFLTRRADPDVDVLVKFSPPVGDRVGRRVADLLVAEHLALELLAAHGYAAARSAIVTGGERVFLEVERFDRVGAHGRVGYVSLRALDADFGAAPTSWSGSLTAVAARWPALRALIPVAAELELFGHFIANTDMHLGNLALALDGLTPIALAPLYDMLPMAYAPRANDLVPIEPLAPRFEARWAASWTRALTLARAYWDVVAQHPEISAEFRAIARAHEPVLVGAAAVGSRLALR
jgi:hypothetical protein